MGRTGGLTGRNPGSAVRRSAWELGLHCRTATPRRGVKGGACGRRWYVGGDVAMRNALYWKIKTRGRVFGFVLGDVVVGEERWKGGWHWGGGRCKNEAEEGVGGPWRALRGGAWVLIGGFREGA